MTERETLERAKLYMEKLAKGINPIDGSRIPDNEVVNNVRLSRCFFYVADVLGRVIDRGGVEPPKKPQKEPFSLTAEQRSRFAFSDTPIPITEISKRINMLSDKENMAPLSYTVIREWLMLQGMLEQTPDGSGKQTMRPTAQGERVGIGLEARTNMTGTYFVVTYDFAAQHLILDNLDAVAEYGRAKKENKGRPWTPEHDRCLMDLHSKDVPIHEIAITLKRDSSAIRSRLKKLGIT